MESDLIRLRKEIHQNPEVSGREEKTAERIHKELSKYKPDEIHTNIGGYGIFALFRSSGKSVKKTILFRAELDAIPVQEETGLPYRSRQKSAMHACGHDGHMAILIGLAKKLNENRPRHVDVYLLFQPAEETGEGAACTLNDSTFRKLRIDHGFALHNLPGFAEHLIVSRGGTFASGSLGVHVTVKGAYSHAAYPEEGLNPSATVARLVQNVDSGLKAFREENSENKVVCTFIKMGERAFGVSPGVAEVGFTIRSASDKNLEQGVRQIHKIIKETGESFDGEISVEKAEPFRATVNSEEGAGIVKKVSEARGFKYQYLESPFPWSEDFGEFRRQFPITIFGLGAGKDKPPLHSEKYDFNDELISTGIAIFQGIVNEYEKV